MNTKRLLTVLSFVIGCFAGSSNAQQSDSRLQLADPTIFYHSGVYYLYGTGSKPYHEGFVVYTSKDLKNWKGPVGATNGYALIKGDAFGNAKFWAPQVFQYNNKFYMAYTANEHIAIATSDSPLGPFRQSVKSSLIEGEKRIDPYVFIDEDDKKYLYHVVVANGGNRIFVAELKDDFSGIKSETLKECISATEHWENTENDKWSVTEGPTVIKKGGIYYLLYSANHFKSKDYAVGYATSKGPFGPWIKSGESPIISRKNIGQNGVGHGDLFKDKNGKWKYVFHSHFSESAVAPRLTTIVDVENFDKKSRDKIKVKSKSFYFLEKAP